MAYIKKIPGFALPFPVSSHCGEPPRNNNHWIWHPQLSLHTAAIVVFTRTFRCKSTLKTRIHISADQRFEFALNGEIVARGPERSDHFHLAVHSYDLLLEEGTHTVSVRCQWLGDMAPLAQMTSCAGFFLIAEGDADTLLSTQKAPWQAAHISGFSFHPSKITWGTGPCYSIAACNIPHDWTIPGTFPSVTATPVNNTFFNYFPVPAELPEMKYSLVPAPSVRFAAFRRDTKDDTTASTPYKIVRDDYLENDADAFSDFMHNQLPYTIPENTHISFLLDFNCYHCLYPTLRTVGGKDSIIQFHYAESLFTDEKGIHKNNRNDYFDKFFLGIHDTFYPDGATTRFDLPWWRAARFILVSFQTGDATLTITSLVFHETHYPLQNELEFCCANSALKNYITPSFRALQMCSHETYMDCPYYEQLMYVGDTRLEALATYVTTTDPRLPRKALKLLDWSRTPEGFTHSRYPSRTPQFIPPFSLWWICMVHDYLMWRGDLSFITDRIPGIHAVIHAFNRYCDDDFLIRNLPGWNFIDWVPTWNGGMPPVPTEAANALINLHYILALQSAEKVSRACGDYDNAEIFADRALHTIYSLQNTFWNDNENAFAYHEDGTGFAHHTQCLAVCAGICSAEQKKAVAHLLTTSNDLDKCTIYFSHYLFDALHHLGETKYILDHLQPWQDAYKNGITTLPETPEPTRSDCHAWGAHILYHYVTKFLGISPVQPGCTQITIAPQLHLFPRISGCVPLPQGRIEVTFDTDTGTGVITIPENVKADFVYNTIHKRLKRGENVLDLPKTGDSP